MKISLQITFLIFAAILLNACSMYYKSPDLRKNFEQGQSQSQQHQTKLDNDYIKNKHIYEQLLSNSNDGSLAPYPELKSSLADMNEKRLNANAQQKVFVALQAQIQQLTYNKQRIESGTDDWKQFKVLKKNFKTASKNYRKASDDYQAASHRFINTLNTYHIANIKVAEFNQQLQGYAIQFDRELNKAKQDLAKSHAIALNHNKKKKEQILLEIDQIVGAIESEHRSFLQLQGDFKDESEGQKQIWSGPGMASYLIVTKMREITDTVKQDAKRINKLAKKL